MSKPKAARAPGITVYFSPEQLAEIDRRRAAAVAGIPGAVLSRSAWARQAALATLEQTDRQTDSPPTKTKKH